MTAWAGVLTVYDAQESGVVNNDGFLTQQKQVRFRGWTGIAECDPSTASDLVECESWEDENWLCRPSIGETAGVRYKESLACYPSEKGCLLCKKGCQFWCGISVERGWTAPTSEETH